MKKNQQVCCIVLSIIVCVIALGSMASMKKEEINLGGTYSMKWYDYVNASKHGNYIVEINGEYLYGSLGSGMLYFPNSIANAQKNWSNFVSKEEAEEYQKRTGNDALYSANNTDDGSSFGIWIRFYDTGFDKEFKESKKQTFSWKNTLYFQSRDVVKKVELDLEGIRNTAKANKAEDISRMYYAHVPQAQIIEIKEMEGASDIVQVGQYLYYIKAKEEKVSIPQELHRYNLDTGKNTKLYTSKHITEFIDIATDGKSIYFYAATDETDSSVVKALKYSIDENKISYDKDMLLPEKAIPKVFRATKFSSWEEIPKEAIWQDDALKMGIVKQKSSAKAWKIIEKYYYGNVYNWFVDNESIIFLMQDEKEKNVGVYRSIDLRTGEEKDIIRIEHEKQISPGIYSDVKINTIGDYRFEIRTFVGGTQIFRNRKSGEIVYSLGWSFYGGSWD